MDTFFQWPQEIKNTWPDHTTTQNYTNPTSNRPQKQRLQSALNCPRCKSNNTKFCYYNNYSISQPRYLCKTCKRYWTVGGILRTVPIGGASRKSKRPSSKKKPILSPPNISSPHQNLDFNPFICNGFGDLPFELDLKNNIDHQSTNLCSSSFSHDNSIISMPLCGDSNSVFSTSGFDYNYMDDMKPSSSFSCDGLENAGYGDNLLESITSSTIIFPFDELSPICTSDHLFEQQLLQGRALW
ncbi:hypothetical protein CASFOL_024654 [Castilleja foliolosa]|uniref:Dof zinc finger protein n=1 Tax=Castilleja foliolosa TaxID=1961234 RepID=A0ABD3CNY2_9LAMI